MAVIRDMEVLEVSHKYNLAPGRGYSTRDVGYLLRRLRNGKTKQGFSGTIRRYYGLWRAKQEK